MIGLVLVAFGEWRGYPPKSPFSYFPTFVFVAAWAVVRWGIWVEATGEPRRPGWREHWLRKATDQALRWFGSFIVISILFGLLLDHLEKFPFRRG